MKPKPRSETSFLMVPVVTVTPGSLERTYCRRTVGSRADHTKHATTLGRGSSVALATQDAHRTPSADDAATCRAGSRRLNCRGALARRKGVNPAAGGV